MKEKISRRDKLINEVHACITVSLHNRGTVNQHVKKYPFFCIHRGNLLFFHTPTDDYTFSDIVITQYIITDSGMDYRELNIKTLKNLFPFLIFKKDRLGGWLSEWYDSNVLLTIFKSRETIIDELLAEL